MDNTGKLAVENILSAVGEMSSDVKHFGTKGMRWGVRKGASEGKASKEDLKWDKNLNKAGAAALVITSAKSRPVVAKINSKPEYKNADFTKPSPLRDKYFAEHAKSFETMLNQELPNHISTSSPTGKFKAEFKVDSPVGPPTLLVTLADTASHSGINSDGSFTVDVTLDDMGKIVSFEMRNDFIAQGENFLEHFGVRGMRWGVRRSKKDRANESGDVEERTKNTSSKADKKTRGGKVDVKDLSDADLRARLNRMSMEKQYAELTRPAANPIKAAGKKIAGNVVRGVAEQTLRNLGQSYATKYTKDYLASGSKAFGGTTKASPLPPPTIL